MIKENKKQVNEFKEDYKEQLQAVGHPNEPFRHISVDTVLATLARDDEPEDMFEINILEPGEEELVFINDLSDIESDESDVEID